MKIDAMREGIITALKAATYQGPAPEVLADAILAELGLVAETDFEGWLIKRVEGSELTKKASIKHFSGYVATHKELGFVENFAPIAGDVPLAYVKQCLELINKTIAAGIYRRQTFRKVG